MNFAFSAYLAGLAFLTVPLILHLLRLKPARVKIFPSFYLLTRKIVRRQRRNNLLKYLILFCRCAALAFFCLAFAWPYFSDTPLEPESVNVIIRDISFSTGTPQVRKALREVLQQELNLTSPAAPALGAVLSDRVDWSGEFTADKEALEAFFDLHESSQMTSGFLQALYQADSRLGAIPAARKYITVITDRQALPWRRLPSGEFIRHADAIRILPLSEAVPRRNAAVCSAAVETPYTEPGLELELQVRLANFSDAETVCTLTVFLEDRPQETRETVLLPLSEKTEKFKLKTPAAEFAALGGKVVLEAEHDDIMLDNVRYFAVNPCRAPDIYMTRTKGFDFIREALRGGMNRDIPLDSRTLAGLPENAPLLILGDCSELDPDAAAAGLEKALDNGAGLIIVYRNDRKTKAVLDHFGIRSAPDTIKQAELEMINFDHPVFREYLKVSAACWFDISFFNVPSLRPPSGARVIAAFNGGLPAVMEMNRGRGRIIVIAAPPDREHTNFQTYGTFLPFWRELVLHGSVNVREEDSFLTCSRPLKLPGGELARDKAGLFRLGEKIYSVNVDTRESDLAPVPASFNCDAMITTAEPGQAAPEIRLARLDRTEDCKGLMLSLLLAFAVIETLLSNRTVN